MLRNILRYENLLELSCKLLIFWLFMHLKGVVELECARAAEVGTKTFKDNFDKNLPVDESRLNNEYKVVAV